MDSLERVRNQMFDTLQAVPFNLSASPAELQQFRPRPVALQNQMQVDSSPAMTIPTGGAGTKITFKVKRETAALAYALPWVIGSPVQMGRKYFDVVRSILSDENVPTTISYDRLLSPDTTSSTTGNNQVQFSYTDGTNTDLVTVTCLSPASYPIFLASLQKGKVQTGMMQMQTSTTAYTAQYANGLNVYKTTPFGKLDTDGIPLISTASSYANQPQIISFPFGKVLDSLTSFGSVIEPTAALELIITVDVIAYLGDS